MNICNIQTLLKEKLNFALYRFPGENEVHLCVSTQCCVYTGPSCNWLNTNGFAIYPFDINRHDIVIIPFSDTYKADYQYVNNIGLNKEFKNVGVSTPKSVHVNMVGQAVELLNNGDFFDKCDEVGHVNTENGVEIAKKHVDLPGLIGSGASKVVLSRVKIEDINKSLDVVFSTILDTYKDAFVFCFNTDATGLWMGASPELLLERDSNGLHTIALAGTRVSCGHEHTNVKNDNLDSCNVDDEVGFDNWDIKNIEEHAIVADYINNVLLASGFTPIISNKYTKKAGKIEHICCDLFVSASQLKEIVAKDTCDENAIFADDCTSAFKNQNLRIGKLLNELSPTPALCGYPKVVAMNLIEKLENHDRGYYGGFCGPNYGDGNFRFYVNIRSMHVSDSDPTKATLFGGGGITAKSDPEKEWEETERKIATLLSVIS